MKAEGGNLRFRAPKDALTIGLKQQIVEHKSEVLALLGRGDGPSGATRSAGPGSEPLPEKADRAVDRPRDRSDPTGPGEAVPISGVMGHSQNSQNGAEARTAVRSEAGEGPLIPISSGPSQNSQNSQNLGASSPTVDSANCANTANGSPAPQDRVGPWPTALFANCANNAKGLRTLLADIHSDGGDDPANRSTTTLESPPESGLAGGSMSEICVPSSDHAIVELANERFVYQKNWSGTRLAGDWIAIDTETAKIQDHEVPPLALASVSSGQAHALVHPDRFAQFILVHRHCHFVTFHVGFDFWVVHQHLEQRGEVEAIECWWAIAEEGRLHDSMLLDALVRLARSGAYPNHRDLGTVAGEYAGLAINKDDPYRLRYAEIIDRPWDQVDPGFFRYAIGDSIATWRTDSILRPMAIDLARSHGVTDQAIAKYGPLTETIQVKAAIVLAAITRHGIHLDLAEAAKVQGVLRERLDEVVGHLRACPETAHLFKTDRKGGLQMTAGGLPSLSRKTLQEILLGVVDEIRADQEGFEFEIPRTPKGEVSTATEQWAELAEHHPFLRDWSAMAETSKLCQFFGGLQSKIVHPRYTTMVLTGRTSCSGPNIQQMPRKAGFREIFRPSPGHFLLAVDYKFIELVALAAICEARFGKSTLADVIRADRDPHAYTAAILLGLDPDQFLALRETDLAKFKEWRQMAKPLNFGIPGGLGPATLVAYARRTYNVPMTVEQAGEFRRRMITEVYPEWDQYLADDPMTNLASSLGTTADACWALLDWKGDRSPALVHAIRRVVLGATLRADGQPYSPRFLEGIWNGLNMLNRSESRAPLLAGRRGSVELCRRLFDSGVATLTGWIRGRVTYAQCRNTPFQHLAAAGGKLAHLAAHAGGLQDHRLRPRRDPRRVAR